MTTQPEITLVQDLQMDADMLKDGFQKNLTELWHSDVVREAAKNALRAADRIEELTKALQNVLDDIENYEQKNHLAPNPPRQYCWDSVARARSALSLEQSGSSK